MTAPNSNPYPCGAVAVNCCGNRVPLALTATFSGANTCGFAATVGLTWDAASSSWKSGKAGCLGQQTLSLICNGNACTGFQLTFQTNPTGCTYTYTLSSCACDPFKLVFSVTMVGGFHACQCCPDGTVFTVTITAPR